MKRWAWWVVPLVVGVVSASPAMAAGVDADYAAAKWDPLHFRPASESATDDQCLACHKEILERPVRVQSPAGVVAEETLAWYQTLNTYDGTQETFHRRHFVSDYAKKVMAMRCITCHEGNDPREDNAHSSATASQTRGATLRKMVNPEICLKCHGQNNYQVMGLPQPWSESGPMFNNSCLTCHAAIRTTRHEVNYLKPKEIEEAGKEDSDVCYGCHGGRAWYRTIYPYPRHPWPGMAKEVPEWAKDRPTESEPRFRAAPGQKASEVPGHRVAASRTH